MFDVDAWVDYLLDAILSWLAEMLCYLFNAMMDIALTIAEFIVPYLPTIPFDMSWVFNFMSVAGAFLPLSTLITLFTLWLTWSGTRWVLSVVLRLFTLGILGRGGTS